MLTIPDEMIEAAHIDGAGELRISPRLVLPLRRAALAQFTSEEVVPFNYILAMSVVSMVPVVIVFLIMQRHIVKGIAQTGFR